MKPLVVCSLLGLVACCACASDPAGPNPAVNGGTSGSAATGGSSAGQAGTSSTAGTMQGGASAGGVAGGGTGAGGSGTSGSAASAGQAGSVGQAGGSGVAAGCANHDYDLCLDFETGIDQARWTGGTDGAITTTDFAHGQHSYRLYPTTSSSTPSASVASRLRAVLGLLFGGVLGVFSAGNCATGLRFGGQAGYEVGAWGGALSGAVLGCLAGLRLGGRRAG